MLCYTQKVFIYVNVDCTPPLYNVITPDKNSLKEIERKLDAVLENSLGQ